MNNTYGNHSCNDCKTKNCPISHHSNKPNMCSYYWPPIANTSPSSGYYQSLNKIAKERNKLK